MRLFKPLCILSLVVCSLSAQDTRGRISGIVTDQQAAVIPGATVTVTNTGTGVSTTLETSTTGSYDAPLLTVGAYEVTAESPGFRKTVRSGITVQQRQQLQIDLELQLGDVTESVTVTGETPILDTNTVASGKVLTQNELTNLPMIANSAALFTRLSPGVDVQPQTQYLTAGMTGGGSSYYAPLRAGVNEWTLDGAPIDAGSGLAWMPGIEEVDEVKVETTNFDAAIGHNAGLNVSFTSKSGTNQLHGSATYQYWNNRWNAASFFRKQDYYRQINEAEAAGDTALADQLRSEPLQAAGHSNNWTAAGSGPVYIPKVFDGRNRLFWTFSYTGHDDKKPARANEINYTVPTEANKLGDFSDLLPAGARYIIHDPYSIQPDPDRPSHFVRTPLPGNKVPEAYMINPLYKEYSSWMPSPNQALVPGNDPEENFLAFGMQNPNNYISFNSKVDAVVTQNHRVFFRWTWSKFLEDARDWTYDSKPGLHGWDQYRRNKAAVLDWSWAKSASTVINVTVAANQFRSKSEHLVASAIKPSDVGMPSYMDEKCGDNCVAPRVQFGPDNAYDEMIWPVDDDPVVRSQSLKANVMHNRGNHSITGGIDFRQHYRNEQGNYGFNAGNFIFTSDFTKKYDDNQLPAADLGHTWAAFAMGLPSTVEIDTISGFAAMNPYYGFHLQDKWRATRTLTITYGLRLEYEQGPTERYDHALTYYDPNVRLPISDAAEAAYAENPIPELPAGQFKVQGGTLYANTNGASRRWWDSELLWLPRVSAAWQFNPKMVLRAGYGIYGDSINVQRNGPNNYGYSRPTSTILTTDFGNTWLAGDPANGVSPLADPFPVREDGTRFDTPIGNALGYNAYLGRSLTYWPQERKHPRVQKWRVSVQRELGANMVVEAAYWGQFADHLSFNDNQRYLPGQYWSTGLERDNANASNLNTNVPNPYHISNFEYLQTEDPTLYQQLSTLSYFTSSTIRKEDLLRGNSQTTGVTGRQFTGKSRSHQLELNFQKRMSDGLSLTATYSRGFGQNRDTIVNEFDREPRFWLPEQTPISHRFVATAVYDFPFGPGRQYLTSGVWSHIVGNWQTGVTYEYRAGDFLGWGNYFYYGDFNSLPNDLTSSTKSLEQWFNTDLPFEKTNSLNPAAYHERIFPLDITSVRRDGINQWSANLRRDFRLREGMTFEVRFDALNLQNRSQFNPPSTNPTSSNFGRITAQTSGVNRFYQLQGRIRF